MIDFLFGVLSTLGALYLYHHFKGGSPAKIVSDLSQWRSFMSQAGDEIAAKINDAVSKIDALVEAKAQAAVEAEKADHQADLSNIGAAADALASKVAP